MDTAAQARSRSPGAAAHAYGPTAMEARPSPTAAHRRSRVMMVTNIVIVVVRPSLPGLSCVGTAPVSDLRRQPHRDRCDMPALKSGQFQFVGAGLAAAVAARNGTCAVG